MATLNLPTGGIHAAAAKSATSVDRLSSAKNIGDLFFADSSRFHRKRVNGLNQIVAVKSPDHIRSGNNNVHANYDDDDNFNLPVTVSQSSFLFPNTLIFSLLYIVFKYSIHFYKSLNLDCA